jgi:alpha-tubulin suppressor-like RCC1 family protein
MTCAVERGGTVWCWGANDRGQLGDGTSSASATPVRALGIDSALSVTTGGTSNFDGLHYRVAFPAFACARLRDRTLRCWGTTFDWLRYGGIVAYNATPQEVSEVSDVTDVTAGSWHACAVTSGAVLCWGDDLWGQLGNDFQSSCSGQDCPEGTGNPPGPVRVAGIELAAAVAGHDSNFSCAVLPDSSVRCWGLITAAGGNSLARARPSTVPYAVASPDGLAVGWQHACAIAPLGGGIQCWGYNGHGELGDGTTTARSVPVNVLLGGAPRAVSAGASHTCAVLSDHTVRCWGDNTWGQLGDGTFTSSTSPVTVSGISDALTVSAGEGHTCAVTITAGILCWGKNATGQLGNGVTSSVGVTTPVEVNGF